MTDYIIKFKPNKIRDGRFLVIKNLNFCKENISVEPTVIQIEEEIPILLFNKSISPIYIDQSSKVVELLEIAGNFMEMTPEDYLKRIK